MRQKQIKKQQQIHEKQMKEEEANTIFIITIQNKKTK